MRPRPGDGVHLRYASGAANAVLARFGRLGPRWRILEVGWSKDVHYDPDGSPAADSVVITIGDDHAREQVLYSLLVTREFAVVNMADQMQDHATDATWGPPLPPCPQHRHPLVTRVLGEVAFWVCPQAEDHCKVAIYPLGRDG